MNATPSLERDAFLLLRDDLFTHLDEVDFLAAKYAPWSAEDARSARAVIPDLVTVIRAFIVMHDMPKPAQPRWCTTCDKAWPCAPFHTIHRLVKDPDADFVRLVRAQRP